MPNRRFELWIRKDGQLVPVDSPPALNLGVHASLSNDETFESESQWSDNDEGEPSELAWPINGAPQEESSESLSTSAIIDETKVCYKSMSLRFILWVLDAASCSLKVSFADVSTGVSVFILLSYELQVLFVQSNSEYIFWSFLLASTVFLSWEFLLYIVAKVLFHSITVTDSPSKSQVDGNFISYVWVVDLLVLISLIVQLCGVLNESVVRVSEAVRLVRCFRLLCRYWVWHQKKALNRCDRDGGTTTSSRVSQSVIGSELKSSTTMRLVVLVLLMLLALPHLLAPPTATSACAFSTQFIQAANIDPSLTKEAKLQFVSVVAEVFGASSDILSPNPVLLQLAAEPLLNGSAAVGADGSDSAQAYVGLTVAQCASFAFNAASGVEYWVSLTLSLQPWERADAFLSILLLVAVAFVMFLAFVIFSDDIDKLVARPLERMMQIVEEVARDPLASFHFDHSAASGTYETDLLEKTFVKIANLLRLCFGAAGENIIRSNLQFEPGVTASAIINPMLPGARVYCVFCFCEIRQFEFATECLGKDVLQFVNSIAAIVAENVNYWSNEGGSVNKNLGKAFIIVFRIGNEVELLRCMEGGQIGGVGSAAVLRRSSFRDGDDESTPVQRAGTPLLQQRRDSASIPRSCSALSAARIKVDKSHRQSKKKHQQIDLRRIPGADRLAGRALISCLKILAEINRHQSVTEYRRNRRLNPRGAPPFSLQLGFGLHAGWAIEGAVGSLNKVTATYLSPHVNIAARLASSSKQFGTSILFSHSFFEVLSPYVQKFCRKLDVITVKGSTVPLGAFTYDCLLIDERSETAGVVRELTSVREIRSSFSPGYSKRVQLEETPEDARAYSVMVYKDYGAGRERAWVNNSLDPEEIFDRDHDLVALRRHVSAQFRERYADGLTAYIAGDWMAAASAFKDCIEIMDKRMSELHESLRDEDFSVTLYQYIASHNFKAPPDWCGHRVLSSK